MGSQAHTLQNGGNARRDRYSAGVHSTPGRVLTSIGTPPILASMERGDVARWVQDFRLYRRQGGPMHSSLLLGNHEWVVEGLWTSQQVDLDLGPWDQRELMHPEEFADLVPRLDTGPQVATDDLDIEAPRAAVGEFRGLLDIGAFNANIKSFQDRHPHLETKTVLEIMSRSLAPVVPYLGNLVKDYIQTCRRMGKPMRIPDIAAKLYSEQASYVRLNRHFGPMRPNPDPRVSIPKAGPAKEQSRSGRKRRRGDAHSDGNVNKVASSTTAQSSQAASEGRSGLVCNYCKRKGHKESECRRKAADQKDKQ